MELDERLFVVASAVAVVIGIWTIIGQSNVILATIGVVSIIAGVVCFLLAVGLYFSDEDEGVEAGQGA